MNSFNYGVCLAVSLFAILAFLIGCVAYSDQNSTIQSVAWIRSSEHGVDAFFGLRRLYLTYDDPVLGVTYSFLSSYGDDTVCGDSWCEACDNDGRGALGLLVVAILAAACTVWLCFCLYQKVERNIVIAGAVCAFLSAFTSMVGLCLFMSDCYNKIDLGVNDIPVNNVPAGFDYNTTLRWGPGSVLVIVGMLIMWLVTFTLLYAMTLVPPTYNPASANKV